MADTHAELAEEWNLPRWSGFWGSRFLGATGGLLADLLAEGAATGLGATHIYPFAPTSLPLEQPADAIALLASDALLTVYPRENPHIDTIARLRAKWSFWTGSPKAGLESEIFASSGGAAVCLVPGDYIVAPDAFVHWSRFWVTFAEGEHTVTGPPIKVGGAVVGTSQLGPTGLDTDSAALTTFVVQHHKPAQWVEWDREYRAGNTLYRSMIYPRIDPAFVDEEPVTPLRYLSIDGIWLPPSIAGPFWPDADTRGLTTTFTAGSVPTANSSPPRLTFDGTEWMIATVNVELSPTTEYYVAARVRRLSDQAGTKYLLALGGTTFQIASVSSAGSIVVTVLNGGVAASATFATGGLPLNAWVDIEVIFDGSQAVAADRVALYLDGVPQTATGTFGTLPAAIQATAADAAICSRASTGAADALHCDVMGLLTDLSIQPRMRMTFDEIRADLIQLLELT